MTAKNILYTRWVVQGAQQYTLLPTSRCVQPTLQYSTYVLGGVYQVHSIQCTTVYSITYQPSRTVEAVQQNNTYEVVCTQYTVYSFNWEYLCTQCTTLDSGVYMIYSVCVCVFSSHPFWTSSSLDVPAGVTQEEGHTGFLIHLPSAVRALIFVARRIQPFLSLVDREVEFCVLTN